MNETDLIQALLLVADSNRAICERLDHIAGELESLIEGQRQTEARVTQLEAERDSRSY